MPTLHFLNVKEGDCTWIKHSDGKNTVVDVSNANALTTEGSTEAPLVKAALDLMEESKGIKGNFRQKKYPVNPIEYLRSFNETSVFRFVLTHPDMDHMDGLKEFFDEFNPANFWDTENTKVIDSFDSTKFDEDDWKFYLSLRDGKPEANPRRLTLYSGEKGKYWNLGEDGTGGGNGLTILAPTKEIVANASATGDHNDYSYVLMYQAQGKKVIIGGDSHDVTWDHILEKHANLVKDTDILIAPHHGRDSGRSYDFLDVLNPKITFFGVARHEHLGYEAWRSRGLEILTNNQGNCFVVDFTDGRADIHCTYKKFADAYRQAIGKSPIYDANLKSWYLKSV